MAKREGDTSVEDDINKMIGEDGDAGDDDADEGQNDTDDQEEEDDSDEGEDKSDGVPDKGTKGDADKGAKDKGKGKSKADDGHLRDKAGNIVARAGAERRMFEQMSQKLMKYEKTDIPALQAKLDAYEKSTNYKEYGVDATGAASALKLYSAFLKDPEATLKWMLTQTQAKGIKVDLGTGTGISPEAIKAMIAEHTAPLREQKEREEADAKSMSDAKKEYDAFLNRFPDGQAQEEGIAFLLQRNPSLSLDGAYYQLKLLFKERGLDWNTPLSEHAKGAQEKGGKRQTQMPRGRNVQTDDVDDADDQKLASVEVSYDDIIRKELKRAGIN